MNKIVIILTAHRTGSSLIASILYSSKTFSDGRFLSGSEENKFGFYEDIDIINFNEKILSFLNITWYSIPPLDSDQINNLLTSELFIKAQRLIKSKIIKDNTFFKDPRMTLLLPFWVKVFESLKIEPKYILSIRDPLQCAKSLLSRNNIPVKYSHLIWKTYYYSILKNINNFILVDYQDLLIQKKVIIKEIFKYLGIKINSKELDLLSNRINPELNNNINQSYKNKEGSYMRSIFIKLLDSYNPNTFSINQNNINDILKSFELKKYNHKIINQYSGLINKSFDEKKSFDESIKKESFSLYLFLKKIIYKFISYFINLILHYSKYKFLLKNNFPLIYDALRKFYGYLIFKNNNYINSLELKDYNWDNISNSYKYNLVDQSLNLLIKKKIDIIIPIYEGYQETVDCIESVINSYSLIDANIIIINDFSPNEKIKNYLKKIANNHNLKIINNIKNEGFVSSVNRGFSQSNNDVLILNSDTKVSHHWLSNIIFSAYSFNDIGTVTPLSNNATICSYPNFNGSNSLPVDLNLFDINNLIRKVNYGQFIEIPTAVGFCMFIKRECLNDVGFFDEKSFGKGYGEENDFSLRAKKNGWKNILLHDTYIFHKGSVSFSNTSIKRKKIAEAILLKRHPKYNLLVQNHINLDKGKVLRSAITIQRIIESKKKVLLYVSHSLGGGADIFLKNHISSLNSDYISLILQPTDSPTQIKIFSTNKDYEFEENLPVNYSELFYFLKCLKIDFIFINHLIGFSEEVINLISNLKNKVYFVAHDYFTICPLGYLNSSPGTYCGLPQEDKCNNCIRKNKLNTEIYKWRKIHSWIFSKTNTIICPSQDIKMRLKKIYPRANYLVNPHQFIKKLSNPIALYKKSPLEKNINILILGHLSFHKGAILLKKLISEIKLKQLNVTFSLLGKNLSDITYPKKYFEAHDGYKSFSDIKHFIQKRKSDAFIFLSTCPETFSFTLSEALCFNLPIIYPNFGSFSERMSGIKLGLKYDHLSPINSIIKIINNNNFKSVCSGTIHNKIINNYSPINKLLNKNEAIKTRIRKKIIVIHNPNYDYCAHLRLIIPLMNSKFDEFSVRFFYDNFYQLRQLSCDALIFNRVQLSLFLPKHISITDFFNYCKSNKIKTIYDLDDLVTELPKDNVEKSFYSSYLYDIKDCLLRSDEIWTSTKYLKTRFLKYNKNISIVPTNLGLNYAPIMPNVNTSKNNKIKILHIGHHNHDNGILNCVKALVRIKKEFQDRVDIYFVGSKKIKYSYFKYIDIAHLPFPLFIETLASDFKFDIGVINLPKNNFNLAKSDIKYQTYSFLGLAQVISQSAVYSNIPKRNYLDCKNTEKSWYRSLHRLILDDKLRIKLANNSSNHYVNEYSKNKNIDVMLSRLKLLLK